MYNLFVLRSVGADMRLWGSVCECVWDTERGEMGEYVWLCWYAGSGGRSPVWPLKIPHLEIARTASTISSCFFNIFYNVLIIIIQHQTIQLILRCIRRCTETHLLLYRTFASWGHSTLRPLPATKAAHLAFKTTQSLLKEASSGAPLPGGGVKNSGGESDHTARSCHMRRGGSRTNRGCFWSSV